MTHEILPRIVAAEQTAAWGADKNYDTAEFVAGCRERGCTPRVSQNNTHRRSAINDRTTRHPGYRISTIKRKRIEEPVRIPKLLATIGWVCLE